MKAITLNGSGVELPVGSRVCGYGFVSIELEAADFRDNRVYEWLREQIAPRMALPIDPDRPDPFARLRDDSQS